MGRRVDRIKLSSARANSPTGLCFCGQWRLFVLDSCARLSWSHSAFESTLNFSIVSYLLFCGYHWRKHLPWRQIHSYCSRVTPTLDRTTLLGAVLPSRRRVRWRCIARVNYVAVDRNDASKLYTTSVISLNLIPLPRYYRYKWSRYRHYRRCSLNSTGGGRLPHRL